MPLEVNWPFPNFSCPNRSWLLSSAAVISVVATVSKVMTNVVNTMKVYNAETLFNALENRAADKPLITVSNHYSCMDDPLLWGFLKYKHIFNQELIRWALAAHDICFTKEWHSRFFSLGKTVPICRGDGVYQKSMDFVLDKLNRGSWVHFFPEGKVNESREFLRLKWGIGRLISECNICPIVIPLWHLGMDNILPNKRPYIPKIGKNVTVLIGKPLEFQDLLKQMKQQKKCPMELRKAVTDVIQDEFYKLKAKTEKLHYSQLIVKSS